jgi:hypothetical protein
VAGEGRQAAAQRPSSLCRKPQLQAPPAPAAHCSSWAPPPPPAARPSGANAPPTGVRRCKDRCAGARRQPTGTVLQSCCASGGSGVSASGALPCPPPPVPVHLHCWAS